MQPSSKFHENKAGMRDNIGIAKGLRSTCVTQALYKGVIFRYSWSIENGAPSSHIHSGVCSLYSW